MFSLWSVRVAVEEEAKKQQPQNIIPFHHHHHHHHHRRSESNCRKTYRWYLQYILHRHQRFFDNSNNSSSIMTDDADDDDGGGGGKEKNLRNVLKHKANKHSAFYRNLLLCTDDDDQNITIKQKEEEEGNVMVQRRRRTGVVLVEEEEKGILNEEKHNVTTSSNIVVQNEQNESDMESIKFPSVERFILNYTDLVQKQMEKISTCKNNNLHPTSGCCYYYSSSNNSSLKRSASSDSALGLMQSDDEPATTTAIVTTTTTIATTAPPSRTLIEAQCVPYSCNRKYSDCDSIELHCESRRQSCVTDDSEEVARYRYWRTPSIVVSDYSDDIVAGLTYDDLEHLQNSQRKDGSLSAESSLNSSCSNLDYCGSSVSVLDAECILLTAPSVRKTSNCSTCSTLSRDDDDEEDDDDVDDDLDDDDATESPLQSLTTSVYGTKPSGWRKLRNIVQWTPFFQTYKKQRYPWVQLAGHQGNFKAGPDQGTILKKLCPKEEKCFQILMKDVLRPYVPEYKGQVTSDDGDCTYLQLEDLLGDFCSPCVMDCKMGVRTYLEEELAKAKEKPKLRKDMYEKMIQIDSTAPHEDEHRLKGVTKPRYMIWRETISSTATLGFRIEGIRKADGTSSKDYKTTKSREQIMDIFKDYTYGFPHAVPKYVQRLKAIKATLLSSEFFKTHEVIGSSLLFVHDRSSANVWLIDFAKTLVLPSGVHIDHNRKWQVGNHEDGFLIGIDNLIAIFIQMLEQQPVIIAPLPTTTTTTTTTIQPTSLNDAREVT